jgi:hypothetical protein
MELGWTVGTVVVKIVAQPSAWQNLAQCSTEELQQEKKMENSECSTT